MDWLTDRLWLLWSIMIVLCLGFWGTILYVAVHFIKMYW